MKTRFAFAGFRHTHILDLLTGVEARPDCEIVACCEEDAGARAELAALGRVRITHENFATMLREIACDVVAIGDCYARRGALAIAALRAGRHVLSDKPLCTAAGELDEIERLAAEKKLSVMLQLDCRGRGAFLKLREIIRAGEIGEVCTIHIAAQHPLLPGTRPAWYFAPGLHGGTINDIAIHAFDLIPWLTGVDWRGIETARAWNAKARAFPHFQDSAQLMATLANGAGVLADFSYLAPDQLGYQLPHYWRITVHGTRGLAETHLFSKDVTLIPDSDPAPVLLPAAADTPRAYLDAFLAEIRGQPQPGALTTADCLRATRLALTAQSRADHRD